MAGSAALSAATWSGEAAAFCNCWVFAEGADDPNMPPIEQADSSSPSAATAESRNPIACLRTPNIPRQLRCNFPLQGEQNGRSTAHCHARDVLHEELFDDPVPDDHGEA